MSNEAKSDESLAKMTMKLPYMQHTWLQCVCDNGMEAVKDLSMPWTVCCRGVLHVYQIRCPNIRWDVPISNKRCPDIRQEMSQYQTRDVPISDEISYIGGGTSWYQRWDVLMNITRVIKTSKCALVVFISGTHILSHVDSHIHTHLMHSITEYSYSMC
jgi:hypothetical protein